MRARATMPERMSQQIRHFPQVWRDIIPVGYSASATRPSLSIQNHNNRIRAEFSDLSFALLYKKEAMP